MYLFLRDKGSFLLGDMVETPATTAKSAVSANNNQWALINAVICRFDK